MKSLLMVIMKTRVHVGCLGGLLCALPNPDPFGAFWFGFGFVQFTYLFNQITDRKEDAVNWQGLHLSCANPKKIIASALGVLVVAGIPAAKSFGLAGLALYLACAFLGAMYSYPFHLKGRRFRVKDILILKNIHFTIVVAFALMALTVLKGGGQIPWLHGLLTVLVYFASEILWDIRDVKGDAPGSTVPQVFGVDAAKWIVTGLMLVALLIYFVLMPGVSLLALVPIGLVLAVTWRAPNVAPSLYHLPVAGWTVFLAFLLYLRVTTPIS